MRRVFLAAVTLLTSLASAAPPFRFSRPINAPIGWARLDLPDDVLDACGPGLPDLRVQDQNGKDIAYVLEQERRATSLRFSIENLESVEKAETIGMIDRGPNPAFADAVTFEIAADDFLKPVRLEGSDDRSSWMDITRGSLFATTGVRMLTLRFARNDRRYLRFRFDDRNGGPLKPVAVVVESSADGASAPQPIPLEVATPRSEETKSSLYSVALPAANLPLIALHFEAEEPAFSRRVRVFERVLFRDEVSRRLLAEATITHSPEGADKTDVPVASVAGRTLEIEIDKGDSPPLTHLRVTALRQKKSLLFHAPESARLLLLYGSSAVRAPQYDLGQALDRGTPKSIREATLGPPTDSGVVAPGLSAPQRGAPLEPAKWKTRSEIELPRLGNVAYLDFERLDDGGFSELRIVDEKNRQVPFIVEQDPHERRRRVRPAILASGTRTVARIEGLDSLSSAEAIELSASGPEYFSRDVTVVEEERDKRGISGQRTLGAARWEKRPDEREGRLKVSIARPQAKSLRVEIENGDNPPVTITEIWVSTPITRINFLFGPGDRLFLLIGNPEAQAPRYDLAMLAGVVLASPAEAARLGPPARLGPITWKTPNWFWGVVVLAVLLLALGLFRTLKTSP